MREVGIIAAFISAIYPYTIYQSSRVLDSTLFTFFLLSITLTAIYVVEERMRWGGFWLGFVIGMGCLVRTVMLFVFLAVCCWIFLEFGWKKSVKIILPCLLSMALVITPWSVRNYTVAEQFILIEAKGMHNAYMGNNPLTLEYIQKKISLDYIWSDKRLPKPSARSALCLPLNCPEHDRWYANRMSQFIRNQPIAYIQLLWGKLISFWSIHLNPGPVGEQHTAVTSFREVLYTISYAPLLFLSVVGIIATFQQRETRLIVLIFAAYTLAHLLIWTATRLRMPLDSLLMIFSGYTLFRGFQLFKQRRFRLRL